MAKKKEQVYGEFGTAGELWQKIDWEGGIGSFFGGYTDEEQFIGTPLENEVKAFIHAQVALEAKLEELGVTEEAAEDLEE